MVPMQDKVTRFSADLVDDAAAEGARQSRSARQQLDHWVRVGRAVSSATSAPRARVEAALSGRLAWAELTDAESTVAHAEVATAIEQRVAASTYAEDFATDGVTTVALDDDGRLVEHRPDGTTSVLGPT